MLQFEESSEYYTKIKVCSHLLSIFIFLAFAAVQTVGVVFDVLNYVNIVLESVFLLLNVVISYKIVKMLKVFEFREVKSTINWVRVITIFSTLSLVIRIVVNVLSETEGSGFPVPETDLDGKSKLLHFGIL